MSTPAPKYDPSMAPKTPGTTYTSPVKKSLFDYKPNIDYNVIDVIDYNVIEVNV